MSIAKSTTGQSIASSNMTDTSTHSSLLGASIGLVFGGGRSGSGSGPYGKFSKKRTVTTETQLKSLTVRPRERKPSETAPVDLLRVVEESERRPALLARGRFQSEVVDANSRRRPGPKSYDEFGAMPRRSRFESMILLAFEISHHLFFQLSITLPTTSTDYPSYTLYKLTASSTFTGNKNIFIATSFKFVPLCNFAFVNQSDLDLHQTLFLSAPPSTSVGDKAYKDSVSYAQTPTLLAAVAMSKTPPTASSSSTLDDIMKDLREQYEKNESLRPFIKKLEGKSTAAEISAIFRDQVKEYDSASYDKLMKSLNPIVNVLCASSSVIGAGVGLVFKPASVIFAGANVLLSVAIVLDHPHSNWSDAEFTQAANGVIASYNALIVIFEDIGNFFHRLEKNTEKATMEAIKDIIAQTMDEVFKIFAFMTKEVKLGRARPFPGI
ncbi:hypothetical protein EI94DRAFT_1709182 [Lactarius quietus]|nr:hypothetical protein EI94DRAFT_1709182 [Lactarius quietus]